MAFSPVLPLLLLAFTSFVPAMAGLHWRAAVKVLEDERRPGRSSTDAIIPLYRNAIRSCGQAGKWQRAVSLLRLAEDDHLPPDSYCYAQAMSACRRAGQWPLTLRLLADLRGSGAPADPFTTSNAIAACERIGDWKRALSILRELDSTSLVCHNAAISACAGSGQWQEALELLTELEIATRLDAQPNVRSYSAAMTACTRAGQWQRALELWARMKERGVRADGVAYGAAVSACAEGAQASRALRLVSDMRRDRVHADVAVYNAAITACARARAWSPARKLLKDMSKWGVRPNLVTYNAALAAAAAARQWRSALGLLRTMGRQEIAPDVASFGAAIAACERSRQWRAALDLLSEAKAAGMVDLTAYNSCISAAARGAGWAAALQLVREAEAAGLRPGARSYGPVLIAASRSAEWRLALEIVSELAEREPGGAVMDAFAGSAVIAALGRQKQWRRAVEMVSLIDQPNAACFTAAAAACGRCRQSDEALHLLARMDECSIVPDGRALQTVAWAAARGGQWASAIATLRRLRSPDGAPLEPAEFLGVALSVCEGEAATFALLQTAREQGVSVDPLTLYQVLLEGWQGGTAGGPSVIALSLLRGLAEGRLPPHGDLRAWNLLCELALERPASEDEECRGDEVGWEATWEGAGEDAAVMEEAGWEAEEVEGAVVTAVEEAAEGAEGEAEEEAAAEEAEEEAAAEEAEEEAVAEEAEEEAEEAAAEVVLLRPLAMGAWEVEARLEAIAAEMIDAEHASEMGDQVMRYVDRTIEDAETLIDRAYRAAVNARALDARIGYAKESRGLQAGSLRAGPRTVEGGGEQERQAELKVDLHGYSVALARAAMRHVLRELQREYAAAAKLPATMQKAVESRATDEQPTFKEATKEKAMEEEEAMEEERLLEERALVVITGRGLGSGTNGPQLRDTVLSLLGDLSPPILAKGVPGNEGRVRVDGASLLHWLRVATHPYK